MAIDEIEEEAAMLAQKRTQKDMLCRRPMDDKQFERIENRIRAFDQNRDDFLQIRFSDDEELKLVQVFRVSEPGMRRVNVGYEMSDLEEDDLRLLGGTVDTETAVRILRKICVEMIPADQIEEIRSFRSPGKI